MQYRLPARYNAIALPLVLSFLMTCIVSGISTMTSLGLTADTIHKWAQAWALSWIVAFPTMVMLLPLARRVVATLVEPPQPRG